MKKNANLKTIVTIVSVLLLCVTLVAAVNAVLETSELPYIYFAGEKLYIHPTDNLDYNSEIYIMWDFDLSGSPFTVIGAGAQSDTDGSANTAAIVSALGAGNYAAKLCSDLNAYGYDDWYLPAKEQLIAMYDQKDNIAGDYTDFEADAYWSSTEYSGDPEVGAWVVVLVDGGVYNDIKENTHLMRCVRDDIPLKELPYIYSAGEKLYIYPTDNSGGCCGAVWGCQGTAIGPGAQSNTSGSENTAAIVAGCLLGDCHEFDYDYGGDLEYCESHSGCSYDSEYGLCSGTYNPVYAAKICSDLSFDGYDDWYLPAKDQLRTMWEQRYNVNYGDYEAQWGEFQPIYYWSSTEYSRKLLDPYSRDYAWNVDFLWGTVRYDYKEQAFVRCVRTAPALPCTDADGDSYAVEGGSCGLVDCNDNNAAVHPGATEVCNGIDDNCNGQVDEDLTRSYYTGPFGTKEIGVCKAGTETCSAGAWLVTISEITPTAEVCDNKDNDCDSEIDENLGATTCGVGECQRIVQNCIGGTTQICTPGSPSAETCDGLDNDCDGQIDENLIQSCYTGPYRTEGVGVCKAGTQTCSAGIWGSCTEQILPSPEIKCNNIDDDCNPNTLDYTTVTGNSYVDKACCVASQCSPFTNHGQYVSCVANARKTYGYIPANDWITIQKTAAQSNIGNCR